MMQLVAGSVEPSLKLTLLNGSGQPVDLSQALSARLRTVEYDVEIFDAAVSHALLADGVLERDWVAGETDIPGRIWVEALVVWPGNREQWFRPAGVVDILPKH